MSRSCSSRVSDLPDGQRLLRTPWLLQWAQRERQWQRQQPQRSLAVRQDEVRSLATFYTSLAPWNNFPHLSGPAQSAMREAICYVKSTARSWSKINAVATTHVTQRGGESHFIPGSFPRGRGSDLEAGLQSVPGSPHPTLTACRTRRLGNNKDKTTTCYRGKGLQATKQCRSCCLIGTSQHASQIGRP